MADDSHESVVASGSEGQTTDPDAMWKPNTPAATSEPTAPVALDPSTPAALTDAPAIAEPEMDASLQVGEAGGQRPHYGGRLAVAGVVVVVVVALLFAAAWMNRRDISTALEARTPVEQPRTTDSRSTSGGGSTPAARRASDHDQDGPPRATYDVPAMTMDTSPRSGAGDSPVSGPGTPLGGTEFPVGGPALDSMPGLPAAAPVPGLDVHGVPEGITPFDQLPPFRGGVSIPGVLAPGSSGRWSPWDRPSPGPVVGPAPTTNAPTGQAGPAAPVPGAPNGTGVTVLQQTPSGSAPPSATTPGAASTESSLPAGTTLPAPVTSTPPAPPPSPSANTAAAVPSSSTAVPSTPPVEVPPTSAAPVASSSTVEPSAQQPTAWDFIANHPNLTRLAEFIRVANLVETYSRPDITVLVPTDEVLQPVVDRLGAEVFYDPVRSLPILQRHVLVGHLAEATLFDQPEPPRTVAGEELAVDGVTRTIDGARLVSADRVQANGAIVHVIDQVLLPESAT